MATWYYSWTDVTGKRATYVISALSKTEAIRKGSDRARKYADGDITSWVCKLKSAG